MRNRIYRICGIIMLSSVALIGLHNIAAVRNLFPFFNSIVLLETMALWAFGFSWLTKGEFLLKDRP